MTNPNRTNNNKLIKFGIYTIGATLIIPIEEENNEVYYLKYPLQFFDSLTNQYINNTLDRVVRELLKQGWSIEILTQPINKLYIKDFAFLGKLNNKETKTMLKDEVKKLKKMQSKHS